MAEGRRNQSYTMATGEEQQADGCSTRPKLAGGLDGSLDALVNVWACLSRFTGCRPGRLGPRMVIDENGNNPNGGAGGRINFPPYLPGPAS